MTDRFLYFHAIAECFSYGVAAISKESVVLNKGQIMLTDVSSFVFFGLTNHASLQLTDV